MAKGKRRAKDSGEHIAFQIARDIVEGRFVQGPHVRAEAQRHLNDLKRDDLFFIPERADHAINWIETYCKLHEGKHHGKPFILEPAQKFIVGLAYGWYRCEIQPDGSVEWRRRITKIYCEMGKGNGKTPLGAALSLYALIAEGEFGAGVYIAASKLDQARIMFDDAVNMAGASPEISAILDQTGTQTITQLTYKPLGSFLKPLARTVATGGSGIRPYHISIDELHEIDKPMIVKNLTAAFKSRQNPMLIFFTNSGFYSAECGLCWEEHEHAIKVAHGNAIDDEILAWVCALDEGDDPFTDPTCWIKANPLLGKVVDEKYIRKQIAECESLPSRRNNNLRLNFCVWTDAETAWIASDVVQAAVDDDLDMMDYIHTEENPGPKGVIAVDLARKNDMFGVSIVFELPNEDAGKPDYALFTHGYTPKKTLMAREKKDKTPYSYWVDEGHLTAHDGASVDFDQVADDLVAIIEAFNIVSIIVDPWEWEHLEKVLKERLRYIPKVRIHPQTWQGREDNPLKMPASVDNTEAVIIEGRLKIKRNPALFAAISSTIMMESTSGQRRPDKAKSTSRIDLAVSSIMGVGGFITIGTLAPPARSVIYDNPDFEI